MNLAFQVKMIILIENASLTFWLYYIL